MTEAEWLADTDPTAMLETLSGKASDRKWRLFAVGCCRQFREGDEDQEFLQAVAIAEQYADGSESKAGLKRARQTARAARHGRGDVSKEAWAALWLAEVAASEKAVGAVASEIGRLTAQEILPSDFRSRSSAVVRCVFGNPFRAVTFRPAWRTATVTSLAQGIYDKRRFADLPVLADALEDAGCTSAEVLGHCRQPGEHVRGCWVVDLALGKE